MKEWTKAEALAHIASNITIDETTGCHEWQGSKTRDGYGQVSIHGLAETFGIKGIHRLAYFLHTDREFEGPHEHVMHSCDNRSCCNPAHLELGDAKLNMAAAWNRGWLKGRVGEMSYSAKISEATAREIIKLIHDGWRTCYIVQKLNVTRDIVSHIRLNRSWRHLPRPAA